MKIFAKNILTVGNRVLKWLVYILLAAFCATLILCLYSFCRHSEGDIADDISLTLDYQNVVHGMVLSAKVKCESLDGSQEVVDWRARFEKWFSRQGEGRVFIQCDENALSACFCEVLDVIISADIKNRCNYREVHLRNQGCEDVQLGVLMMPLAPQDVVDQIEFCVSNDKVVSVGDIKNGSVAAKIVSHIPSPIQYEENGRPSIANCGYIICTHGTRMANVIHLIREMNQCGYVAVDIYQSGFWFEDLVTEMYNVQTL